MRATTSAEELKGPWAGGHPPAMFKLTQWAFDGLEEMCHFMYNNPRKDWAGNGCSSLSLRRYAEMSNEYGMDLGSLDPLPKMVFKYYEERKGKRAALARYERIEKQYRKETGADW